MRETAAYAAASRPTPPRCVPRLPAARSLAWSPPAETLPCPHADSSL